MNLSRLYSHIPTKDGQSLLNDLADVYTQQLGSNGETITLVSYFQKDLHLGPEFNFITNKYVLFVEHGNQLNTNTFSWSFTLYNQNGTDVTTQHDLTELNDNSQQYTFFLSPAPPMAALDGYKIVIDCQVLLQGQTYDLNLSHNLLPIANSISALANDDHAALGNPTCTYFIANHFRDFLGQAAYDSEGYINLVSGIVYKNLLSEWENMQASGGLQNIYTTLFEDTVYRDRIEGNGDYSTLSLSEIGIAAIQLPLLWMQFDIASNFQRDANLESILRQGFDDHETTFIDLYHLSVFPKSAIRYATEILKMLFEHFQNDCVPNNGDYIYNTLLEGNDRLQRLDTWRNLSPANFQEHYQLMLNLVTEYYTGPQNFLSMILLNRHFWRDFVLVARHDWSPYIIRLLDWWPLTPAQLQAVFTLADADLLNQIRLIFNREYQNFFLDTVNRRAHFFAQIREEVGLGIVANTESLNYSPTGLINTFSYFANHAAEATQYGRVGSSPYSGPGEHPADQEAIANRAYANRLGNGNIASGDGWSFRGKGYIQLTGRDNYTNVQGEIDLRSPDSGIDIIATPEDILTPEGGLISAMAFWSFNDLQDLADNGATHADVNAITAVVNLYTNSYEERRDHFEETIVIFS